MGLRAGTPGPDCPGFKSQPFHLLAVCLRQIALPLPRTCEYVSLSVKGGLMLNSEWGDYLDYPSGPSVITRAL